MGLELNVKQLNKYRTGWQKYNEDAIKKDMSKLWLKRDQDYMEYLIKDKTQFNNEIDLILSFDKCADNDDIVGVQRLLKDNPKYGLILGYYPARSGSARHTAIISNVDDSKTIKKYLKKYNSYNSPFLLICRPYPEGGHSINNFWYLRKKARLIIESEFKISHIKSGLHHLYLEFREKGLVK